MWGVMKITPADTTLEYITVGITGPGKVHEMDEKYLPTVTVDKGGTGRGAIPENNFLVGGPDGSYYLNKKTPAEVLALIGAAGKSTVIEATLAASGWADGAYTLTVNGVTDTSNQEILPAVEITAEQLEALQAANIQDGGQAENTITLKAYGDVPTIDIPIRVIKRGD